MLALGEALDTDLFYNRKLNRTLLTGSLSSVSHCSSPGRLSAEDAVYFVDCMVKNGEHAADTRSHRRTALNSTA